METGCVLCEAGNEVTLCLVEIKVLRTQWNKEIKASFKGRHVKGWIRVKPAVLSDKDSRSVASCYIDTGYNLSSKSKGSFAGIVLHSRGLRKIMTKLRVRQIKQDSFLTAATLMLTFYHFSGH
jgi:hypothetical protein